MKTKKERDLKIAQMREQFNLRFTTLGPELPDEIKREFVLHGIKSGSKCFSRRKRNKMIVDTTQNKMELKQDLNYVFTNHDHSEEIDVNTINRVFGLPDINSVLKDFQHWTRITDESKAVSLQYSLFREPGHIKDQDQWINGWLLTPVRDLGIREKPEEDILYVTSVYPCFGFEIAESMYLYRLNHLPGVIPADGMGLGTVIARTNTFGEFQGVVLKGHT